MRIAIVGGGIGGLTAALALRHHGIDSLVLERALKHTEIGAGIQVAANGTLVLRELGLEPALAACATVPLRYDYRDLSTGRLLYRAPLGEWGAAQYGALMYNVHRADLLDMLCRAVPADIVQLGAKCIEVRQCANSATVVLESGEEFEADAVIGADGIHSVVREVLRGPEAKQFANILMWRALVPRERIEHLALPVAGNYWFGVKRNVISYWVRPDLYTLLAAVPAQEVTRESWTDSGDKDDLLRSFQGAEPRVQQILEAVDSTFITGMYYRDPIQSWTQGRVSLLGDAAHPMVPYLAQGACQAMEDAWVLATCLKRHGKSAVPAALAEYEQRRRPRTTRIQAGARFAVKTAHEPDEESVRMRNGRWRGMARIDPLAETSWGFAWDYDVLTAARDPAGNVVGLSATREGKQMQRPDSQQAFDLWKGVMAPEDVARGHVGQREAYERFLITNFPAPEHLECTPVELLGVPAIRVVNGPIDPDSPAILHFHGGGYVAGSARSSVEYAGRLSRAIGGACYTVDYRLAPEHPYPAAFDDAFDALRGLLELGVDPARLFISGESAGGGLALALAVSAVRAGLPPAAGVIAICPFTDLTLGGESIRTYSGEDPAADRDALALMAASYFQGHEPTDPHVSPLFGDLAGLPPLFLMASCGEVLESDTTRFAEKARIAGVDVTEELVEDSVHVFTLFPFLSDTALALEKIGRWVSDRVRP